MPLKKESNTVEVVKEIGDTPPSSDDGVAYKSTQDFKEIRSRCLAEDRLFEDPEFPPPSGSTWRRPSEISENPQFFVDGPSRFDAKQGSLGDCSLVAAVANLTLYTKLFFHVVPDDQSFDKDYAGVFHFRLWQFGHWVEVVIDDRLPTYSQGGLSFLYSTRKNEFWSALLEKAFAKLLSTYDELVLFPNTAMATLTGGVAESFFEEADIKSIILKAYERNSLMVVVNDGPSIEAIPVGHAFSITRIQYVDINTPGHAGKILLLRIRNPWGGWNEWTGAWSEKSSEWNNISQTEKERLDLTVDKDGEFWMSYDDFVTYFKRVNICHLDPKFLPEGCSTKKWETSGFVGEFVKGVTASGCSRNPQFTVTFTDPDEGDVENKCTMIVEIRHPLDRRHYGRKTIGFAMYKLPDNTNVSMPLDVNAFKDYCLKSYDAQGITTARLKVEPGMYVIAPFNAPDLEGKFMLRVFSEKRNILVAHVGDVTEVPADMEPANTVKVQE